MKTILALDPGNHTGWCYRQEDGVLFGGTIHENHLDVAHLISYWRPQMVVYESFNLYPQMAKSLAWNSFYPCEVIGVIKYLCMSQQIPVCVQAPSVKKYAGGFGADWDDLLSVSKDQKEFGPWKELGIMEHTKDAYLHMKYFMRYNEKKYK